jgi:hypothetical protein
MKAKPMVLFLVARVPASGNGKMCEPVALCSTREKADAACVTPEHGYVPVTIDGHFGKGNIPFVDEKPWPLCPCCGYPGRFIPMLGKFQHEIGRVKAVA